MQIDRRLDGDEKKPALCGAGFDGAVCDQNV
jgi:hypothetical protein